MQSQQGRMQSNIVAIDIGGTLSKVAIACSKQKADLVFQSLTHDIDRLKISTELNGQNTNLSIFMMMFADIDQFFTFIEQKVFRILENVIIVATGGGALKYKDKINLIIQKSLHNCKSQLKVLMNEFQALILAMDLLINSKLKYQFKIGQKSLKHLVVKAQSNQNQIFFKESFEMNVPLILANIGSGMSVLKLSQNQNHTLEFKRLGGSALGGGFFVGLQKISNENFCFQKFSQKVLKKQELEIMEPCIDNLAQIIGLYSDIDDQQTKNILITGGFAKANVIRKEFAKNLSSKQVFFTQIDGLMSVIGIVYSEWKKLNFG